MNGVEHIIKCDDPLLLPMARSRIAAIRACGMKFGSQTFSMNGSTVNVQVKGEQNYIKIERINSILWVMVSVTKRAVVGPIPSGSVGVSLNKTRATKLIYIDRPVGIGSPIQIDIEETTPGPKFKLYHEGSTNYIEKKYGTSFSGHEISNSQGGALTGFAPYSFEAATWCSTICIEGAAQNTAVFAEPPRTSGHWPDNLVEPPPLPTPPMRGSGYLPDASTKYTTEVHWREATKTFTLIRGGIHIPYYIQAHAGIDNVPYAVEVNVVRDPYPHNDWYSYDLVPAVQQLYIPYSVVDGEAFYGIHFGAESPFTPPMSWGNTHHEWHRVSEPPVSRITDPTFMKDGTLVIQTYKTERIERYTGSSHYAYLAGPINSAPMPTIPDMSRNEHRMKKEGVCIQNDDPKVPEYAYVPKPLDDEGNWESRYTREDVAVSTQGKRFIRTHSGIYDRGMYLKFPSFVGTWLTDEYYIKPDDGLRFRVHKMDSAKPTDTVIDLTMAKPLTKDVEFFDKVLTLSEEAEWYITEDQTTFYRHFEFENYQYSIDIQIKASSSSPGQTL